MNSRCSGFPWIERAVAEIECIHESLRLFMNIKKKFKRKWIKVKEKNVWTMIYVIFMIVVFVIWFNSYGVGDWFCCWLVTDV